MSRFDLISESCQGLILVVNNVMV